MSAKLEQTEVRLLIEKDFLDKLLSRMGAVKATDLTRAALTLLDWASEEAAQGRLILSSDKKGQDVRRLVMTELSRVKEVHKEAQVA